MKGILFDIDDTLYNQVEPFAKAYDAVFGKDLPVSIDKLFVQSRKCSDEVFEVSQRGEMSMEDMYIYRIQKAFAHYDIEVSRWQALDFQSWYEYYGKRIYLSETVKDMLTFCKGKVKLGIITNGPLSRQWGKVNILGLTQWVNKSDIFVSAEVGFAKPDRRVFDLAAERMGLGDERYYVGDSYSNDIIGAMDAGWQAIWLNRRSHSIADEAPRYFRCVRAEEELYATVKEIVSITT